MHEQNSHHMIIISCHGNSHMELQAEAEKEVKSSYSFTVNT